MVLQVLFVDDDSDEFYLFNEALEHSGLNVSLKRANNGVNLMQVLAEAEKPDVIFMDINMPYKDGVETLTEIRKNSSFKNLPVVIYSTNKNESRIDDCYANGANLFVVKPNNFDGMVQVVNKVCTVDWKNHQQPSRDQFVIVAE